MSTPAASSSLPTSLGPLGRLGEPAWLRSPGFDALLLFGTAGLAIAVGSAAALESAWLLPLLLVNLWGLGYHHVAATFTRIAFDTQSLRQHRFLVFALPPLVLVGVLTLVVQLGAWSVATIYLYWQWYHYTRQSYGVEQIYWRRAGGAGTRDRATWAVIYGVPVWGILHRSAQAQPTFLGMEVMYLPVAGWMATAAGALALGACGLWLVLRAGEAVRGELRVAHSLYVVTHVAVFASAYVVIERIDPGWLLINVWHNAQYLLIVWMYNTNRFREGVDPQHRLLSTLSQPRNVALYFAACLAVSTLAYLALGGIASSFSVAAVAGVLVVGQTANFHHYIVDAVIWRLRKSAVRETVGASAS